MPDPRQSPAMQQYHAFRKEHPDCIVFFQMGDFFELFDSQAEEMSRALGLTLAQRTKGVPMAGVPIVQGHTYIRRAIELGYRVAVVEQVQDAKEAKGVVERAVTRLLTPGTLLDDDLVDEATPVRLAAVAFLDSGDAGTVGVAIAEPSTGALEIFACDAAELETRLSARRPAELLCVETHGDPPPRLTRLARALNVSLTPRPGWHFRRDEALEAIREQYRVRTLAGFGLRDDDPEIPAIGVLLRYFRETQPGRSSPHEPLAHLAPPTRADDTGHCRLDTVSLRALEVEQTIRGSRLEGSLLGVFLAKRSACRTPMGKRLLREWLCAPLATSDAIRARQARIATLVEDRRLASDLAERLDEIRDIARIGGRLALGRATPRDLVALGRSLTAAAVLPDDLTGADAFADRRAQLADLAEILAPIGARITRECVEEAPAHLREGGLFRDGIDADLDEARSLQRDAGEWLARYQADLIAEFDLPSLKVGFNKVFGYYIELPAAQARRAPDRLTRKQTLKNAERYITPELKEFEDKVLGAGARAIDREQRLFDALCAAVLPFADSIRTLAEAVAALDAESALADVAHARGWVRPDIDDDAGLVIIAGRHPVLDETLGDSFVPNDTILADRPTHAEESLSQTGTALEADSSSDPDSDPHAAPHTTPGLALITGPNMAGKSTYIRQTALLVLLAQAGSFVPARAMRLSPCDRLFTRVGADDALHEGQSTFMVEMTETANILNHASARSLVILDEIGRGTSTLDGLSLAWAIAERLAEIGCRSLFATHYHELTDLATRLPQRVRTLRVLVREWDDEIVFLHAIAPGRADQSYGIQVARLAGIPSPVIARAKQVLDSLRVHQEEGLDAAGATPRPARTNHTHRPAPASQLALFAEPEPHPVVEELRELKLETLSPLEAFDLLRRLKDNAAGDDPDRAKKNESTK